MRAILATSAFLALLGIGCAAFAYGQARPERTPAARYRSPSQLLSAPIPDSLPNAAELRRGQYLVRAGDCAACHSPERGPVLSGGLALKTPFGTIYSTNLTSDAQTGVGRMKPETFYAALHDGVGPRGGQIYPAMPYNYFTRVSRADSDAILAYLQTTPAVSARRPANRLVFPLNFRPLVRGWKLLFFRRGQFRAEPDKSAEWNRGAYLVTGLGHCGSCHTPKNLLAADRSGRALWGGVIDTWTAPDLTSNPRTGLGAWSADDIVEYLKTGRNAHANAGGAMADVVSGSASLLSDQDLRAIAVYLKDTPASRSASPRPPSAGAMRRGGAIYSDACASCHMADGGGQPRVFPSLRGNAAVQQGDATGLAHLLLGGTRTAATATRPTALAMPSFAWKLTDQEVADVSTYIRNSWGNRASPVAAGKVRSVRRDLGLTTVRLSDNSGDHPQRAQGRRALAAPPARP